MAELDYLLSRSRQVIADRLAALGLPIAATEVRDAEAGIDADLAVPLFRSAKLLGRNPHELATQLAERFDRSGTDFAAVTALRGYLNFRFAPARLAAGVLADYSRNPAGYGASELGRGQRVVIDYSSPNIAKPFAVGHLRSTIIGQALRNILECLGYQVIGDNHLGDWGTQFGKLLCAFDRWGDEAELANNPTATLLALYVRFHQEAKAEPALEAAARDWFRRLETGDPVARSRWERFVALSRAEFNRIYELLGVRFDTVLGESFYADRLEPLVQQALARGIARREKPPAAATGADEEIGPDETVVVMPLDAAGIDVPLILQKSDGTSLYATRELATAEYRIATWQPQKILYVVGNEQQFYFRQFAAAMRLLGHETPCIHVGFGLVRLPSGRMSTRAGRVILLEEVIREAIRRAGAILADRDLPAAEKEQIAGRVGIGAIKYADLSVSRQKEVVFDWDRMLALDGDSAPYLQYAWTRTRSILRRAEIEPSAQAALLLTLPEEQTLLRELARYPETIVAAAEAYEPHRIANRIYRVAREFSVFYDRVPVLRAEPRELAAARLKLVEMTGAVIGHGLGLLGIETVDRM